MRRLTRQLVLYLLVFAPIASISFAAQAALKMDVQSKNITENSDVVRGDLESA